MKIRFNTSIAAEKYSFNAGKELDSDSSDCRMSEDELAAFVKAGVADEVVTTKKSGKKSQDKSDSDDK